MVKRTLKTLVDPFRHRLYIPSHLAVCISDLFRRHSDLSSDIRHLNFAVAWLKHAQDVTNDGGVSGVYSFSKGWRTSYPETTGYIIPTFLKLYQFTKDGEYLQRASRMADWLVSIQLESGAFQGEHIGETIRPIVFNTGQVLIGLVSIYKQTGDERYKSSAIRAGNWLLDVQDTDGAWRKFTYNDIPHVYHTRVAWALLELNNIASGAYLESAVRNINWALDNQLPNGWFKNNAFKQSNDPYLHNIAYAIRGILESAILLDNNDLLRSAVKPSEVLMRKFEINGSLPATCNERWKNTQGNYSCLTGNAQMAVIWLRLFQVTNDGRFLNAAIKMSDYLKKLQNLSSRNRGINGGIKGSHPIWGKYQRFEYPNWAAKFFIDLILLQEEIMSDLERIL